MRTPRARFAVFAFGGIVLLLVALAWFRTPLFNGLGRIPDPPSDEIRLPILATTALQTLDPIKSVELVQYNLDLQIFECLVAVARNGEIVPALAEKWDISADGKLWTFQLRRARFADDVCFPDGKGRVVTTDDVFASWKRGLSAKSGSLNSWALSTRVVGGEAFAKGVTADVEGFHKIDDRAFSIRLSEPDRNFITRLTVLSTAVVPREALERYGEQFGLHPVGTGPFRLKEWVRGESLLLERNSSYGMEKGWQPKAATISRARFTFFRSEAQVANAFADGQLDVREVNGADLAQLSNLTATSELEKRYSPARLIRPGQVCSLHLLAPLIGSEYAFGSSSALRRNLTETFDHRQLSASAVGPLGSVTKTLMLPPTVLLDSPAPAEPQAQTNNHSIDATEDSSLRGKTVRVAYVSSRTDDVVVALLQQWLKDRGANIRLFPSASVNALFASVGEVKPDLTLIYWSPYYPNLDNYLTALLTASRPVPNFTGYSSPELDSAVASLRFSGQDVMSQTKAEIRELLDRDMPWIPLYYETPLMLAQSRVEGFSMNPVSVFLLSEVELRK